MALRLQAAEAAQVAFDSVGRGYDASNDLSLKYCKGGSTNSRLIEIDEVSSRDIILPGGVSILNVSKSIECEKGEQIRIRSGVLKFDQMAMQFNQDLSLTGISREMSSGPFNAMFELSGCWQRDFACTKSLAFDGVFVSVYTASLAQSQMVLSDHVKEAIPSSWEPAAIARFIKTYGTHIVASVEMGGKDVIYVKQLRSSNLQTADVQKMLNDMADERFMDADRQQSIVSEQIGSSCQDVISMYKRCGGNYNRNLPHNEWLDSIQLTPDVISMSFLPITSLLNQIPACEFLSHAIRLYLRYKPPLEGLHDFLEFQLGRQWAPVLGDVPFGRQAKQRNLFLQFKLLGPKLYVNSSQVEVGQRPVTGLRLFVEGNRNNRLAICMEHLVSLPMNFQLTDDPDGNFREQLYDRKYCKKVQWRWFSHVCTAPIESIKDELIVTGAQLLVENHKQKSILVLRLRFSTVTGARIVRAPEWDGSAEMRALRIVELEKKEDPGIDGTGTNISSSIYPGGPPMPKWAPKLLKLVDSTEIKRGPQDTPGYWVVSGARLAVDKGKISLRVKYSVFTCSPRNDI